MPTPNDFKVFDFGNAAPENRQFSSKTPVDPAEIYQGAEDQLAKNLELQHYLLNRPPDHPMNGPFNPPDPLPESAPVVEKSYEPVPVSYPRPGRESGEESTDPQGMVNYPAAPVVKVG